MASGFLILITFFTRIPIGYKVIYNEENFKKSLGLYSLMGAVIGLLLFIISFMGNVFGVNSIRGLILTISYTIITGGIHLDGLSDTTDGLFSGRAGDKIFEIMSDSRIGAFGVLSLIFIVLSQFVLFSNVNMFICIIMPIVGRTAVIIGSWNKKYAKKSKGMGNIFIESINTHILLINVLVLIVFCLILPNRLITLFSSFLTLFISYLISNWIEKKIGGMTGDTCGFITEISQIIFLLIVIFMEGLL